MKFYKFKFTQVQPCHHRWPASVGWGLPAEEYDPLEIDFYHGCRNWFLPPWKL